LSIVSDDPANASEVEEEEDEEEEEEESNGAKTFGFLFDARSILLYLFNSASLPSISVFRLSTSFCNAAPLALACDKAFSSSLTFVSANTLASLISASSSPVAAREYMNADAEFPTGCVVDKEEEEEEASTGTRLWPFIDAGPLGTSTSPAPTITLGVGAVYTSFGAEKKSLLTLGCRGEAPLMALMVLLAVAPGPFPALNIF